MIEWSQCQLQRSPGNGSSLDRMKSNKEVLVQSGNYSSALPGIICFFGYRFYVMLQPQRAHATQYLSCRSKEIPSRFINMIVNFRHSRSFSGCSAQPGIYQRAASHQTLSIHLPPHSVCSGVFAFRLVRKIFCALKRRSVPRFLGLSWWHTGSRLCPSLPRATFECSSRSFQNSSGRHGLT